MYSETFSESIEKGDVTHITDGNGGYVFIARRHFSNVPINLIEIDKSGRVSVPKASVLSRQENKYGVWRQCGTCEINLSNIIYFGETFNKGYIYEILLVGFTYLKVDN